MRKHIVRRRPLLDADAEELIHQILRFLMYAKALYMDDAATLEDVREAVTTLEEIKPVAQRVLGGAYPTTTGIENNLRMARAKLLSREE